MGMINLIDLLKSEKNDAFKFNKNSCDLNIMSKEFANYE